MNNEKRKTKRAARFVLVFAIATQLLSGQQWTCRWPYGHPLYPQAWEGHKASTYHAYIPGDNIKGGTPCWWSYYGAQVPYMKTYKADGWPVQDYWPIASARVHHGVSYYHNNVIFAPTHAASETRAYGKDSPWNGYTLSSNDEDIRRWDCYLWDDSAFEGTQDYHELIYFSGFGAYAEMGQAQINMYGSAANPLENSLARIKWDVNVVTSYWKGYDYTVAYANVSHTCFPAAAIQANGKLLYHYVPPRTDYSYVFQCLAVQSGMISGLIAGQQQIPCNY